MNYQVHYDKLIDRARNRSINEYTETHHVVPRCIGGTDEPDNLVKLTPEEHFVAHQLLVKIYPDNKKLIYAAVLMTRGHQGKRSNNKFYGWIRKQFAQTHSANMKGQKRPKTKEHIENHKLSLLNSNKQIGWPKGKTRGPMSEEGKLKRSLATKGRPQPKDEKWRKSQSLVQSGRVHTKITCPYCNKIGGGNSMKRWHFDNCKQKEQSWHNHQ